MLAATDEWREREHAARESAHLTIERMLLLRLATNLNIFVGADRLVAFVARWRFIVVAGGGRPRA